jgi:hypothetical protein
VMHIRRAPVVGVGHLLLGVSGGLVFIWFDEG